MKTILFVKTTSEADTFIGQNFLILDGDSGDVIYTVEQSPLSSSDIIFAGIATSGVPPTFTAVLTDSTGNAIAAFEGSRMKGFRPRCLVTDLETPSETMQIKSRLISFSQDSVVNKSRTLTFLSKGWTVFTAKTEILNSTGVQIGVLKIINFLRASKVQKEFPAAADVFSETAILRMVITLTASVTTQDIKAIVCNAYFLTFRKLV